MLITPAGFAVGPREWDLVLTAIHYDSFGWAFPAGMRGVAWPHGGYL